VTGSNFLSFSIGSSEKSWWLFTMTDDSLSAILSHDSGSAILAHLDTLVDATTLTNGALSGDIDLIGLVAHFGAVQCFHELIRSGVSPLHCAAPARDAIHFASASGHLSLVQILVEEHDQLYNTDYLGQTCLHIAVLSNCVDVVEYLIGKAAALDHRSAGGMTPLHIAIDKSLRR
jgi:ankyrin repeat protein